MKKLLFIFPFLALFSGCSFGQEATTVHTISHNPIFQENCLGNEYCEMVHVQNIKTFHEYDQYVSKASEYSLFAPLVFEVKERFTSIDSATVKVSDCENINHAAIKLSCEYTAKLNADPSFSCANEKDEDVKMLTSKTTKSKSWTTVNAKKTCENIALKKNAESCDETNSQCVFWKAKQTKNFDLCEKIKDNDQMYSQCIIASVFDAQKPYDAVCGENEDCYNTLGTVVSLVGNFNAVAVQENSCTALKEGAGKTACEKSKIFLMAQAKNMPSLCDGNENCEQYFYQKIAYESPQKTPKEACSVFKNIQACEEEVSNFYAISSKKPEYCKDMVCFNALHSHITNSEMCNHLVFDTEENRESCTFYAIVQQAIQEESFKKCETIESFWSQDNCFDFVLDSFAHKKMLNTEKCTVFEDELEQLECLEKMQAQKSWQEKNLSFCTIHNESSDRCVRYAIEYSSGTFPIESCSTASSQESQQYCSDLISWGNLEDMGVKSLEQCTILHDSDLYKKCLSSFIDDHSENIATLFQPTVCLNNSNEENKKLCLEKLASKTNAPEFCSDTQCVRDIFHKQFSSVAANIPPQTFVHSLCDTAGSKSLGTTEQEELKTNCVQEMQSEYAEKMLDISLCPVSDYFCPNHVISFLDKKEFSIEYIQRLPFSKEQIALLFINVFDKPLERESVFDGYFNYTTLDEILKKPELAHLTEDQKKSLQTLRQFFDKNWWNAECEKIQSNEVDTVELLHQSCKEMVKEATL